MTCSVAELEIPPSVAVIVIGPPTATPVAKPALLIVALDGLLVVQVTEVVKSTVLASLYVPVAVNCWVAALAIVGVAGAIAMEVSVALFTVKVVVPETPA